MVTLATVEAQLKKAGCNFRFWGRAEIKELCQILLPGETIASAINGQYEAGFAMLVATDFRVLLIDKKPKYLTLKDIRFDMITELDFAHRMMNSTIRIYTPNKELRFTSTNGPRLRKLFNHTQHKMMEIRHRFMMQQFKQQHDLSNTPPGIAMAQQYNFQLPEQVRFPEESGAQRGHYSADAQPGEEHKRLAAAMGAAGLRHIAHGGQILKEYVSVPFHQRWRKRPYGYSRDSVQQPQ